jgi:hypothetical protein
MLRKAIASAVALSLVASPVLAQSSIRTPEPAIEQVDDADQLRRRGFILPLLGIAAILLLLWATDTWPFEDDDEPISP